MDERVCAGGCVHVSIRAWDVRAWADMGVNVRAIIFVRAVVYMIFYKTGER